MKKIYCAPTVDIFNIISERHLLLDSIKIESTENPIEDEDDIGFTKERGEFNDSFWD